MKVVLNSLPPARVDTPSAALSVLKAFMADNGIETDVIYWNILLDHLLPPFERNTDTIHFDLLPYLYLIAGEQGDHIAQAKANAHMKSQLPLHDILNDNSDYLAGAKTVLDETVARELSRYSRDESLLFGIPCKYEQWIPGMVLAGYIKQLFPASKIVIGGLRNRDKAGSIMDICANFDFAIWGEGEYPLLELARASGDAAGDLERVPRLIFRGEGGPLQSSDTETSEIYDMNGRVFPDHDDYFRYLKISGRNDHPVILPLESSRGCTWNACRFCVYPEGYENRKKDPEVLKEEICHLLDRYDTPYFAFMDNDIAANDHKRLGRMLDDLISINQQRKIHFIAEVIHKGFSTQTMEKLPRAGFERVHFGYESLSDRLLTKMNKRTTFSDNIFFVKFARKYGVRLPSANIICGAVGEEDIDILESIDNLHFLRFYFDRELFCHNIIPLRVAAHSDFHDMIPKGQLIKWDENLIFQLLPAEMTRDVDRFSLFDFSARPDPLWELFSKINDFYYSHKYTYGISREGARTVYRESFDGQPVVELAIGDLAYRILQKVNSDIMDFDNLFDALSEHGQEIDERSVRAALDRLKEKHLVYFNDSYRSIISVIDAEQALAS